MTATARVDLDAAMLARSWYVDVNTGTHASPVWTPVSGLIECLPTTPAKMKDVTTFDDAGTTAEQKTGGSWGLKLLLKRAPQRASLASYDAGQEALRAKSLLMGAANIAEVRWYEVNGTGYPLTEAWQGYAAVEWTEKNGGQDDDRRVECTLSSHGARTALAYNPASV